VATSVVVGRDRQPHLTFSPGRIAPADPAWTTSRKPLAGEFSWRGRTFFAIANHFNSKGGDQPLSGRFQPPQRSSETQRHAQATLVAGFVDSLGGGGRPVPAVVLGDLNDFDFSATADVLTGGGRLLDLPRTLPLPQRYTYVFEGNSQVLDHILLTPALAGTGAGTSRYDYDVVHVNSEFADQVSDHEPQVVRLRF
jgi:predicted extracellular nuclease